MNFPWARKQEQRAVGVEDFFGRPLPGGGRITPDRCARLAPVFAAVRTVTESLSSLPIHIVERQGDIRRRVEHPALQALGNSAMSRQTLLETLISALELRGNSYSEVVRNGAAPMALWPIEHSRVRPVREGARVWYDVSGRDGVQRVGQERILHLRFGVLSRDGITGCDPCALLADDLQAAENSRDAAKNFLQNGMQPSGTLSHPASLSEKAAQRLREQFRKRYSGTDKTGEMLVLEEGLAYNTISSDPERSQLLQTREFDTRTVARIWNIPASKLGDPSSRGYNGLEADNTAFVTQSILPRVRRIEAELNRSLLNDDPRYSFHFELDGLLRATTADRYNAYQKATGGAAWATPNSIRALENMPPIEGGDKLYLTPGAKSADTNNGDTANGGGAENVDNES